MSTTAYAVQSAEALFGPISLERRAPGPEDVEIEILYCGVCHSDLHTARSEWPGTRYPCVPGHEIVGRVTAVGAKVGDSRSAISPPSAAWSTAAGACFSCDDGLEQYCEHGFTATYNGPLDGSRREHLRRLFGADRRRRAFRAVDSPCGHAARRRRAAALRRHHHLVAAEALGRRARARRSAIVGIGGLGHMGVKLAHALGAHVVAFTTSPSKARGGARARRRRGRGFHRPAAMAARAGSLDFILDTVAVAHDLDAYVTC